MPSELQYVFNTVGLSGSNHLRTGEEVTPSFSSLNKVTSSGVHTIVTLGLK